LILRQIARFGATFGAALDASLQPQNSLDFLDVLANPFLLLLQTVRPILA
jgi:hypothetical protein